MSIVIAAGFCRLVPLIHSYVVAGSKWPGTKLFNLSQVIFSKKQFQNQSELQIAQS